ncbi:hypothetical protein LY90DRAFT_516364, partial [Neocallimastix californiae]
MDIEKYTLNDKHNNKNLTIKDIIKENLNYNERNDKNIITNLNDTNYFHDNNINKNKTRYNNKYIYNKHNNTINKENTKSNSYKDDTKMNSKNFIDEYNSKFIHNDNNKLFSRDTFDFTYEINKERKKITNNNENNIDDLPSTSNNILNYNNCDSEIPNFEFKKFNSNEFFKNTNPVKKSRKGKEVIYEDITPKQIILSHRPLLFPCLEGIKTVKNTSENFKNSSLNNSKNNSSPYHKSCLEHESNSPEYYHKIINSIINDKDYDMPDSSNNINTSHSDIKMTEITSNPLRKRP